MTSSQQPRHLRHAVLGITIVFLIASARVTAQGQWPQFRGAGSRGIADGPHPLPVAFGPDQNLVWKCATGAGNASPCVFGDRIFVTAHAGNDLETICIDSKNGAVRWRRAVRADGLEKTHRINGPASSTPVVCGSPSSGPSDSESGGGASGREGSRVYAYLGSFGLVCYDFAGEEQWRRRFPAAKNTFGTAASPIVYRDFLILNRDTNEESFLEAIHRETGKTAWKCDRTGFQSGWSTPVVWQNRGIDELLVYGAFQLKAYDPRTGKERWSVPGLADEPCITPVTGQGLVFVTSYNMRTNPEVIGLPTFAKLLEDYDKDGSRTLDREEVKPNKSILSRIDADGEGDHPLRGFFRFLDADRDGQLTEVEWQKMAAWLGTFKHANALVAIRPGDADKRAAEIAWQHPRGVPECPSPLYHDGRVYLVKNGGIVSCIDAATGKARYQARLGSRGPCYASPVVGDGKIYTASARGVVTVFRTGDELQVLARNDLKERIMATPALVDGRVYIRTATSLYAFGLREEKR